MWIGVWLLLNLFFLWCKIWFSLKMKHMKSTLLLRNNIYARAPITILCIIYLFAYRNMYFYYTFYFIYRIYNIYEAYSILLEDILNIHRVHATACTLLREAYWRGMALYVHAENTCCTSWSSFGCLPNLFAIPVLWLLTEILSNWGGEQLLMN